MGVLDGQAVSAAVTNPAFLDANADDVALGKIGFQNTDGVSGSFITNIQRAVNNLWSTTGATETTPGTTYSAPASTISDGQTHQAALTALANKFHPSTGHKHTGGSGDAPPVAASSIASVPLLGYIEQGTDITGANGASSNISSQFSGKTASTGQTVAGVVSTSPYNRASLRQATGTNTGDKIVDTLGNEVYGRITNSGSTWTLTYYVLIGPTETAYTLPSQNVRFFYQELFNPLLNPPTYSQFAVIPSDNQTVDVVAATTSMQGKVSLSNTSPADIMASANAGTPTASVANADHTHRGVRSIAAATFAELFGDVVFAPGANVTFDQVGQTITINTPGSLGIQENLAGPVNGTNVTFGPLSQTPNSEQSVIVMVDRTVVEHSFWSLSGLSIVFQGGFVPQLGQNVYVWYLINGGVPPTPPVVTGTDNLLYHSISGGEAAAKQFTISPTPAAATRVLVDVIGGGPARFNVDFTISSNIFNWSGFALDGVLTSGDIVRLYYLS